MHIQVASWFPTELGFETSCQKKQHKTNWKEQQLFFAFCCRNIYVYIYIYIYIYILCIYIYIIIYIYIYMSIFISIYIFSAVSQRTMLMCSHVCHSQFIFFLKVLLPALHVYLRTHFLWVGPWAVPCFEEYIYIYIYIYMYYIIFICFNVQRPIPPILGSNTISSGQLGACSRWNPSLASQLPFGKHTKNIKKLWNIIIFHGTINYFYGNFQ